MKNDSLILSRNIVMPTLGLAVILATAALPARAEDNTVLKPSAFEPEAATSASAPLRPVAAITSTPSAPAPASASAGVAAAADVREEVATNQAEFEPEPLPPLRVGDAALNLLAWQREGVIASPTPRPIPGDIAYRSYARYLKSFEYPIPESFSSSIKPGSGGSSSGSGK